MKTSKKILFTTLSLSIAASLTAGVALMASADEETRTREFNAKYDAMYEDFDRADVSDTTSGNDKVNLGEKAYLSVSDIKGAVDEDHSIYKQGTPAGEQGAGNLVLIMRSPDKSVKIDDLILRTRYNDNTPRYDKSLSELYDGDLEELPELTDEWQKYVINFANSYEDDEVYEGTTVKVNAGTILGFHILADAAAEGKLDISSIYYTADDSDANPNSRKILNEFLGTGTLKDMGSADSWWADSFNYSVVKRAPELSPGGVLTVTKSEATANYEYAYVVAEGDTEHLTVATTTDGSTWSEAKQYSATVEISAVKGFKFEYTGTASAKINNIFLTNFEEDKLASAIPVIDARTTQKLEDFNVAQSTISGDYNEMTTAPQMAHANLWYRLSYMNADKVSVKDGALVFDATQDLGTDPSSNYIDYKFFSKQAASGRFMVMKVKGEDGGSLDGLSLFIGLSETFSKEVKIINTHPALGLDFAGMDDGNPYKTEDGWYYIVADVEASGFYDAGGAPGSYDSMELFYRGTGKLYVDEIFFANELILDQNEMDVTFVQNDAVVEKMQIAEVSGYSYCGGISMSFDGGNANVLKLDITAKDDNFDISNLRLEFVGNGVRWASENAEGTLVTTDGKLLNQLTYEKDVATTVYIDLEKSGITAPCTFAHVHLGDCKALEISNGQLLTQVSASEAVFYDYDNAVVVQKDGKPAVIELVAVQEGWQGAGGVDVVFGDADILKFTLTPTADEFNPDGIRIAFSAVDKFLWFSQNNQGVLLTTDGKLLNQLTYEKDKPTEILIDLAACDLKNYAGEMYVHTNGTGTGSFKIENITAISKQLDTDHAFTVKEDDGNSNKVVDFVATAVNDYQYGGYVGALTGQKGNGYTMLALTITIEEGTDLSTLRFQFTEGNKWAGENAEGCLYLIDGTLLADAGFVPGVAKTVYIDLAKSGVELGDFHIHTTGTATGNFKIENITAISYMGASHFYKEAMANLPVYETPDVVAPSVSIKTATKATEGDTIKIEYTASDDVTATDKLDVTVTVKDKDGKDVTLTNNSFKAAVGVYTVTVTVRDEAGNETQENIQITVSAKPAETMPDTVAPSVNITTSATATEGDTVKIEYTASDDVTATDKLTVTVTVKDKNDKEVTLTNNSFTAAVGEYTVTVTVRDEAGNEKTATSKITVSAKSTEEPPHEEPSGCGSSSGCGSTVANEGLAVIIAMITIAGVVAVVKLIKKRQ